MNKTVNPIYAAIATFLTLVLISIGIIIYFASLGEVWAVFTIGVIVGASLIGMGLLFSVGSTLAVGNWNMKENLAMMQQQNRAMVTQNRAMSAQNQAVKSLIPIEDAMPDNVIPINHPVFSEWEGING